jgi:3-O-methylgallate 3,4-dioxygenase
MAEIVLSQGFAHSPLMVVEDSLWWVTAELDYSSELLIDTTGNPVTYQRLVEQNGNRFEHMARPEVWREQFTTARAAVARAADDFERADLDVVVVIGNDQLELFTYRNMPALSIFYGEELLTGVMPPVPMPDGPIRDGIDALWPQMLVGYAMDEHHRVATKPAFARELLEQLIDKGFDVGGHDATPQDGPCAGFGHGYGVVLAQLIRDSGIPMVPVLVNTYYPPSQPTPSRCYDLGVALRSAIEASSAKLRVGLVASGGLSHFVTDEDLDRRVLKGLRERSEADLRGLPRERLNSGNSEIRNWVTIAAASPHLHLQWDEYVPVYRTAAGTGCGMAFATWS